MAEEIICPNCGGPNPKDTAFCGKCGTKLSGNGQDEQERDPLIGAMVGDRFLVHAKLGEGGMGVVYRAEQTAIQRTVALKVLHPHLTREKDLHARFQNEAAAASRLNHPNTITVYDFGKTRDGSLYIAMEFIQGTSLDDEICKGGPMDWRRACQIAVQICGSLQDAHDHNIVHRDLKPENVMLCERGGEKDVVKVLDFGIAKILGDDSGDQRKALTKTGMVFGTPQYMSPEQIRGEKVDSRSDIYSLGIILYEMISGGLPFKSESPMGVLTKHLMEAPKSLNTLKLRASLPEQLEDVVMSTLAKEASDRPTSMRDLADKLMAAAGLGGTGLLAAQRQAADAGQPRSTAVISPPIVGKAPVSGVARTESMGAFDGGSHVASADAGKGKGALIGLILGALLLLGGGGAAAWYFLAGPGALTSGPPTLASNQLTMPGPAGPQAGLPVQPPVAVPVDEDTASSDQAQGTVASLPAVIEDDKDDENEEAKPAQRSDVRCKLARMDDDPVTAAVGAYLMSKQGAVRKCAVDEGLTAKFSFSIPKNATSLEKLVARSSTGMEGCLETIMNSAQSPKTAEEDRLGTVAFTIGKRKGAVHLCTIKVSTKPARAPMKPGGVKQIAPITPGLIKINKDKSN